MVEIAVSGLLTQSLDKRYSTEGWQGKRRILFLRLYAYEIFMNSRCVNAASTRSATQCSITCTRRSLLYVAVFAMQFWAQDPIAPIFSMIYLLLRKRNCMLLSILWEAKTSVSGRNFHCRSVRLWFLSPMTNVRQYGGHVDRCLSDADYENFCWVWNLTM